MLAAFETAFVPPEASVVELPLWFAWLSAVAIVLLFPVTNAPAEELTYRGHAQTQLRRSGWPLWAAISVPSLAFGDRKSTRLNSSHVAISYAVFCLQKKTKSHTESTTL